LILQALPLADTRIQSGSVSDILFPAGRANAAVRGGKADILVIKEIE